MSKAKLTIYNFPFFILPAVINFMKSVCPSAMLEIEVEEGQKKNTQISCLVFKIFKQKLSKMLLPSKKNYGNFTSGNDERFSIKKNV